MKLFREVEKEPFALITAEEAAVWEAKRVPGKWRWIGNKAVRFAIVYFIIYGLFEWFVGAGTLPSLAFLLVITLAGVIAGLMEWNQHEFQYQRYLHEKSKEVEKPPLGNWRSDQEITEYETERTNS